MEVLVRRASLWGKSAVSRYANVGFSPAAFVLTQPHRRLLMFAQACTRESARGFRGPGVCFRRSCSRSAARNER